MLKSGKFIRFTHLEWLYGSLLARVFHTSTLNMLKEWQLHPTRVIKLFETTFYI